MTRIEMLKDLLKMYDAAYSDAASSFTGLDAKAQNTVSLAGIFLGAVFAFFNGNYLTKVAQAGGVTILILLAFVVLLLLAAIIFCVLAMRIRVINLNDLSLALQEVEEIIAVEDEELEGTQLNYLRGQITKTSDVVDEIRGVNLRKANAVKWGQLLLLIAIIVVGGIMFVVLYEIDSQVISNR